ncbi:MAG: hypothetical protein FWD86_00755 [Firmicutes bacterium]|nr:hypothetical protein [Bacillota bacterium]
MKKRLKIISLLVLSIFVLAFFSACGTVDTDIRLLPALPWSFSGQSISEVSTFEIIRYAVDLDQNGNEIHTIVNDPTNSFVTYTLLQNHSLQFEIGKTPTQIPMAGYTLVSMNLSVFYDYVDSAGQNHAYTHTIVSHSVFNSLTLAARYSYRSANVTDVMREGVFLTRNSHNLWMNYTSGQGRIVTLPNEDQHAQTTNRSIRGGGTNQAYCNEYLFFLLRALQSTGGGDEGHAWAQAINFFLPFDDLMADRRIAQRDLSQSTTSAVVPVQRLSDQISILTDEDDDSDDEDEESESMIEQSASASADVVRVNAGLCNDFVKQTFDIPPHRTSAPNFWDNPAIARRTTIGLAEERTGPNIVLYYSAFPTVGNRALPTGPDFALDKVLLQVVTQVYGFRGSSFDTRTPVYRQVFRLVNYDNGTV